MPRTAFVHIGTHKTGTTYLQNWLRLNRRLLHDLHLVYPKIGLTDYGSDHQELSLQARKTKGKLGDTGEWAKLKRLLQTSDHDLIISAETFSDKIEKASVSNKIAAFFEELGMATTFVVLLRDVPAYMNSRYVQEARRLSQHQSFESFVENVRHKRAFNYAKLLEPFEQAAPVLVLPYTPKGEPLERRFLKALGRRPLDDDTDRVKPVARLNQSVGTAAIAVARKVVKELPNDISPTDLKFKQLVFRDLCKAHDLNRDAFVGCDSEAAHRIRSEFSEYTNDIAQRYFNMPWYVMVPPESMFQKFDASLVAGYENSSDLDDIVDRVLKAQPGVKGPVLHNMKVLARKLRW